MGRLGVSPENADELCRLVDQLPAIDLEGIFTHFSSADTDSQYTSLQLSRFNRALARLNRSGFRFQYIHAANSAALFDPTRQPLQSHSVRTIALRTEPTGLR